MDLGSEYLGGRRLWGQLVGLTWMGMGKRGESHIKTKPSLEHKDTSVGKSSLMKGCRARYEYDGDQHIQTLNARESSGGNVVQKCTPVSKYTLVWKRTPLQNVLRFGAIRDLYPSAPENVIPVAPAPD